jgi:hypothetical protein
MSTLDLREIIENLLTYWFHVFYSVDLRKHFF